uniref:Uncharacterized protein n=1 Tax=Meloidogyne floridensis TaxID=298350 RepID=A0A915NT68_9BILA
MEVKNVFEQALLDELEAIDENNDEIPLIKGMLYYSACSAPTGVKMAASWFCSTSIKTLMDGATYATTKIMPSHTLHHPLTSLLNKILIDMLGAKIRVDFVKEAKCPPAFGNLYTWDPESHSLVIARFETKEQKEPSDIIFIPGTSVQTFEVLEDEGEQNNQISTTNNEETKTFKGMRNTEEMKAKMDNLFFPTKIAAGMDNCSEQMNIGELAMNDEEKWENERLCSGQKEAVDECIEEEWNRIQRGRRRRNDRKRGQEWRRKLENLIGNSTVVKRLVLAVAADRVFDDPAQKDHFVGN